MASVVSNTDIKCAEKSPFTLECSKKRRKMGIVSSLFKKEVSVEEQEKTQQVRTGFMDLIQDYHRKALNLQEKAKLTPESANELITYNDTTYKWLTDNPKATLQEIWAQRDTYKHHVENILSTDKPRAMFMSYYAGLPLVADEYSKINIIDDEQRKFIVKEGEIAKEWYASKKTKTNKIELESYLENSISRILQSITDLNKRVLVNEALKNIKNGSAEEYESMQSSVKKNEKRVKEAEFKAETIFETACGTALTIFGSVFLFVILAFSGSLVANTAIHRPVSYRVLYFIWGFIPLFVIPVFLYFIFKRIRTGPLHLYTLLPIVSSTPEYENELGWFTRLIRSAVVYYPDTAIDTMAAEFKKSLEKYAQAQA